MFARAQARKDNLHHLGRVEALVRARFSLPPEALVMVSERPGRDPGFPPLETMVLFWTDRDSRHRLRVFKPVAQVQAGDLPLAWMRPALLDDGDADCC